MPDKQPASLLYRKEGYSVGSIKFDLIVNENHSLVNTVSSHPVEQGSEISDHIRNELQEGSLQGWVSNYTINNPETAENKVSTTYTAFLDLWKSKELVSIVTVLQVYKDVAITNVSISRDSNNNESQNFQVSFKQVKIVQLRKIELSVNVNPKNMDTSLERQSATKVTLGRTVGQ